MAIKKLYLDKKVLIANKPQGGGQPNSGVPGTSLLNLENYVDLKGYIIDVVDDSTTEFTSINVDTINESTATNGVTVDGVLLKDSQVTTDVILEKTSAAGVTVDSVLLKDGGVSNSAVTQIAAFYPQVAQNNITAGTGGAVAVTNYLTTINTDGTDDAFTLANGTQIGQLKKILLVADGGGNGVVTPATAFAGGTAATFGDAGDYLILQWSGAAWVVLENSGVTIA